MFDADVVREMNQRFCCIIVQMAFVILKLLLRILYEANKVRSFCVVVIVTSLFTFDKYYIYTFIVSTWR